MGMEDVGPCFFDDLIEAGAGTLHLGQLTQHRQPLRRGGGLRRAVEGPSSCFVDEAIEAILLGRRHLHRVPRSEEHTSELQSLMRISYAVFCLKKNNTSRH